MQRAGSAKTLLVAGVMSGTSVDGVDVAVCRIAPARSDNGTPGIKLLGHLGVAYPKAVRAALLRVMEGEPIPAAELSRLNWRLGAVYADAVERAVAQVGVKLGLVACHGQTVYHQAAAAPYLGARVRATWQIGEASVIAERLHVPVASDFRPADLAAGGQGAPLVPMLDYVMFRSAKINRVLQNLGGIANLTAIPAGASVDDLLAFDTGPANMVVDYCMEELYGKKFDRGGKVARSGRVLGDAIVQALREPFFAMLPPKSCGREEFGEVFGERFIAMCRKAGAKDADVVATATALTAQSVIEAYSRFVWPHLGQAAPLARTEFIVAGGGAQNETLMRMLHDGLEPLGVKVKLMDELGIPAQAKEAVAFALLGWLSWHGRPGNVPSATGAARGVVLGKITCV